MAILRAKDISKMNSKEIEERIKDLKSEFIKEQANKAKGGKLKIREIKRTIARLHTFNRLNKEKTPEKKSAENKTKKK